MGGCRIFSDLGDFAAFPKGREDDMFKVSNKLDDRHIPRCFTIAEELCAEGAEIDEDGRDYFVELTA